MNRMGRILGGVLLAGTAANPAWGQESRSEPADGGWTVKVAYGFKQLEEDHWAPADSQDEASLMLDLAPAAWRTAGWQGRLALDLHYGWASGSTIEGPDTVDSKTVTAEVNPGLRAVLSLGSLVDVSAGGGVCLGWIKSRADGPGGDTSDSDFGVGFWYDIGFDFKLGGGITIGIDFGSSWYDVEIDGHTLDGGGDRLGFTFGLSY